MGFFLEQIIDLVRKYVFCLWLFFFAYGVVSGYLTYQSILSPPGFRDWLRNSVESVICKYKFLCARTEATKCSK